MASGSGRLETKKTSRATSVALVLTRPLVIEIALCQSFAVQFLSPNPGSINHLRRPGSLNLPPKKKCPLPNFFIRENKLLILVARIKSIICFVKTLAVHIKKHMKFIVNLDFFFQSRENVKSRYFSLQAQLEQRGWNCSLRNDPT